MLPNGSRRTPDHALARRHAHFYLAVASEAEAGLDRSRNGVGALRRFDQEYAKLRSALRRCFARDDTEFGLQIASHLILY